jgi:GxxExxY protein
MLCQQEIASRRNRVKEEFSALSHHVIGCAIEVHSVLGPGLLEEIYKQCLAREFELKSIPFVSEAEVPVSYKDWHLRLAIAPIF